MSANKPTFRLNAVTIACLDLDRSARFYEQVLGAVRDRREENACLWYKLGSTWITLAPNASAPTRARLGEHPMVMLWLETDDLPAAERRFAKHEVTILQPSDGMQMVIADPDGIAVEIWQARSPD